MSRQHLARLTGILYALNIAIGIFAIAWTRQDKPVGDLINLAGAAEYALVVILLGCLLQPAARGLSWAVAAVGLIACAVSGAALAHLFAFPPRVNPVVVFGPYCLGLGELIVRTGLLPRWLGFGLVAAGMSWLTFAVPAFALRLAPWNTVVGAVPELLLTLWLLVFGMRDRGTDQARSTV